METKEMDLDRILISIGISSGLAGFNYITQAVEFLRNQQIHTNVMTVYDELSLINKEQPSIQIIERAIRYAVKKAYQKNVIFNKIYCGRPNNRDFLYDLAFHQNIFEDIIREESEKTKIAPVIPNPSKFLNNKE